MSSSDPKPKLSEQDITGLKFFDQLAPLLQRAMGKTKVPATFDALTQIFARIGARDVL